MPGSRRDEAFVFEFAVGLQHGVGIDGDLADDLFDGRQLVADAQSSEAQGALHLLDDLLVRRDSGVAVQSKLDHVVTLSLGD